MGIVIKVENLGKKYIISHQQERYTALRDIMANTAKKAVKKVIGKSETLPKKEEFWALRNINFEVNKGDRIGIIGRNGAGKSTLLKLLSRITEPTTGKIKIKGKIASLLEVGTGFHPELTGRENIFLNGAVLGMSKKETLKKFDEIVDFSGVEKFIDTPVKRYSSGMYIRLAFAVAAHLETEVLIIDEVLAVGDFVFQKKCLGKMEDVSKNEGRTILFVSHNMTAIKQLCSSVVCLNSGILSFYEKNIDRGIELYLNNEKEKIFLNVDQNQFEDENLKLLEFRIVDINGKTMQGDIANDANIFIEIHFVLKTNDPAFNIGYALYGGGQLYYWSLSTDSSEDEWPKLKLGKNIIRGAIPSNFLNEGDYIIKLYATFHFRKAIINPEYDNTPALYLTINGGLSKSLYWYNRRPGLCAPVIKWKTIEIEK